MTPAAAKPEEALPKTGSLARIYGQIVISLENCILPQDKLENTPSQQDGLDKEIECELRILGCELIQTAGILLKLPQVAMATGQVLFQRFYYTKSLVQYNMETTAMSCVCLASKIEEAPRRIRDVINVFHHIKQVRAQKPIVPLLIDQQYITLKTQVIKAERRVLKELGFCVHVKHPHKLIVMYLQVLGLEKNQNVMQMAWNFMNDSLRTDVFVRYQPETIACACIYLTARKLSIPLPNNPPWFGIFKCSEEEIIDVCYRVYELYRRSKPNAEQLEEAVESLKKKYQESRVKVKIIDGTPPPATTASTATAPATTATNPVVPVSAIQHHTDRSNGAAHNAWSGFISRAPPPEDTKKNGQSGDDKVGKESDSRRNSRSRSRSRDSDRRRSRSRDRHRSRRTSRERSRSPRRGGGGGGGSSLKKKRRSRSVSSSPGSHAKSSRKR